MPRPIALAERGMEAQVGIRALRRACAPLYEAAMASGDFDVMSETHALADTLALAGRQAKRLTGYAEGLTCPDGRAGLWHGSAA
jgi:hypothetical protein